MARGPIRVGHLISPFGPGAITTDKYSIPLVIAGLDRWYIKESYPADQEPQRIDRGSFEVSDWRLSKKLNNCQFFRPPPFETRGEFRYLTIPAYRLPRWYVCRQSKPDGDLKGYRQMVYVPADTRTNNDVKMLPPKGPKDPVRFISICPHGHLDDFPWVMWLGCPVGDDGQTPAQGHELYMKDNGGDNLASIRITCQCNPRRSVSLAGITDMDRNPDGELARDKLTGLPTGSVLSARLRDGKHPECHGRRPWLDVAAPPQACNGPLVGTLVSATSVYFPDTESSIFIPPPKAAADDVLMQELVQAIVDLSDFAKIRALWLNNQQSDAESRVVGGLHKANKTLFQKADAVQDAIAKALQIAAQIGGPIPITTEPASDDSDAVAYRREEFEKLRQDFEQHAERRLVVRGTLVPDGLTHYFSRVSLVERLTETRAAIGFSRIVEPRSGTPAMRAADAIAGQYFLRPPEDDDIWLPAVQAFGEGIYLELNEEKLVEWLNAEQTKQFLETRLQSDYLARWQGDRFLWPAVALDGQAMRKWAARYLIVHSLAHAMINQLVFECGYSSASLRERLYVSADSQAPMAGLLIYTAAGDAEGTLGGLVRMGRPNKLQPTVVRAINRVSWCSADPICSEVDAQGPDRTNRAACHACLLLPETSCETVNRGLDRALLTGTPTSQGAGFFSGLLSW